MNVRKKHRVEMPLQENNLAAAIQEMCTSFVNSMGVTTQEVMNAIREVGDNPRDVERYLANQKWKK